MKNLLFIVLVFSFSALAGDKLYFKNQTLKPQSDLSLESIETTGYFVLQFSEPPHAQWLEFLGEAGVEFGFYIPDDAYNVRITTSKAFEAAKNFPKVSFLGKLDRALFVDRNLPRPSIFNNSVKTFLIKLAVPSAYQDFLNFIKTNNIKVTVNKLTETTLVVSGSLSELDHGVEFGGAIWIEEMPQLQTFEVQFEEATPQAGDYRDLSGYESGTKVMGFETAWSRGFNGEGQVVGMSDTGLDRGSLTEIHKDFLGRVTKGRALGMFAKSWEDPMGHGTHVAGSILSDGVVSGGLLKGGANKAQLVAQSMWSPMLNNIMIPQSFEALYGDARNQDQATIHSNSWGSAANLGAYDSFSASVDEISWKYPDLLLVFAAGNSGQDLDANGIIDENSVSSPGTGKNVLTVGASKNLVSNGGIQKAMKELRDGTKKWGAEPIASSKLSENINGIAAFSSRGPTADGRIKPEIVAPGTNILSTRSRHPQASPLWGVYNDDYVWCGGTSMATPLTAGAAAVTRQYLQSLGFKNPSAALVKAALIHGAKDLYPGQFGEGPKQELATLRPNVHEGYGRVDLDKTTNLSDVNIVDEAKGLETGGTKEFTVRLEKGQKFHATMVYTDAPGNPSAGKALVNDLDLLVTSAGGQKFYPNNMKGPDFKNNVEVVEFAAESAGAYTVSVAGRTVPTPKGGGIGQPYAIILNR